jgi:hypothetical protein
MAENTCPIQVTFIDTATGKPFATVTLPADHLPQSFEAETTFHLGDEDWSVVKADPMTAEEFIQTGKLTITLSKLFSIDPKKILYTLPTICDAIPAIAEGSTKLRKRVFELHEDDWRQREFISVDHRDAIEAEFASIDRIFREESIDTGSFLAFRTLHVRSLIQAPINTQISLAQIAAGLLTGSEAYEGIAYEREAGLIQGGFAWQPGPHTLYGQQQEGFVTTLGLRINTGAATISQDFITFLASLMAAQRLYLVDWCNTILVSAEAETLHQYFSRLLS